MNDYGRKADPYRKLAMRYDSRIERLIKPLRVKAMEMFPAREGMRVLDVGCGTGSFLDLYHKAGCAVFGIDCSPSMLSLAREKLGERASLHMGDASNMPYTVNTFDLVIFVLSLHEMPHSARLSALSEAFRVLKKNGRMLFVDYQYGPLKFIAGWLEKVVIVYFEMRAGREHFKNYRNFLRRGGLPGLMSEHKLSVEKMDTAYNGNIRLYLVSKT